MRPRLEGNRQLHLDDELFRDSSPSSGDEANLRALATPEDMHPSMSAEMGAPQPSMSSMVGEINRPPTEVPEDELAISRFLDRSYEPEEEMASSVPPPMDEPPTPMDEPLTDDDGVDESYEAQLQEAMTAKMGDPGWETPPFEAGNEGGFEPHKTSTPPDNPDDYIALLLAAGFPPDQIDQMVLSEFGYMSSPGGNRGLPPAEAPATFGVEDRTVDRAARHKLLRGSSGHW